MTTQVNLYNGHYENIEADTYQQIRRETYGNDLGQTSWITLDEGEKFCRWLNLAPSKQVLEIASGTGGFAAYVARKYHVEVSGVDINQEGINAAIERARREGLTAALHFQVANASHPLPFPDTRFDALFCNDAIGHLTNRFAVLQDWYRILKPSGRLVYTDPILVSGQLTYEEIKTRCSIGHHFFTPLGFNEQLLNESGFHLILVEDVTANVTLTASRWYEARKKHKAKLLRIEKQEQYDGLQRFLLTTHKLAEEGRLSRYVFVAAKKKSY